MVLSLKKYDYPEDIILSATPSEEIVIQEQAPGLYETKSMGFVNSFDMSYNMTFLTRDGSIECVLSDMKLGNTAAMTKTWKVFIYTEKMENQKKP